MSARSLVLLDIPNLGLKINLKIHGPHRNNTTPISKWWKSRENLNNLVLPRGQEQYERQLKKELFISYCRWAIQLFSKKKNACSHQAHVREHISLCIPTLNFRLTSCSTDMQEGMGFKHSPLRDIKQTTKRNQRNDGCFKYSNTRPHAQKYFLPQVAFVGCLDLQQMWGKGHSSETTGQNPNSQIISIETFLTSDFGLKILMQPSNSKHHINWDVLPKTS